MNATKSRWKHRSNSILTFFNTNLFVISRLKHIEPKKSIDFIIYSQNMFFVVFVRILDSKNTTQHETHLEQWTRINLALLKIIAFYSDHNIIEISKQSSVWRFATIFANVSINSNLSNAKITTIVFFQIIWMRNNAEVKS